MRQRQRKKEEEVEEEEGEEGRWKIDSKLFTLGI